MNETLKRSLSGAVYIFLLVASILFSTESFFILFGIFLLITVVEFCDLVQINKIIPILLAGAIYFLFYLTNFKQEIAFLFKPAIIPTLVALSVTLLVFIKCLVFLFDEKSTQIDSISKYIYLIGYIILPFIFITKIPFGVKGYNPKIIISIFILIWTNDTFAF